MSIPSEKIRVKRPFIESVEIKYDVYPKYENCKQLVNVIGYITLIRYDLWTDVMDEDTETLPYNVGWTSIKPPRQRWRVSFYFDASQPDKPCTMNGLSYLNISNTKEICALVTHKVRHALGTEYVVL